MPVTKFEVIQCGQLTSIVFEHSCLLGEFHHRLIEAHRDAVEVRIKGGEEFSPMDVFFDVVESLKDYKTRWQILDLYDLAFTETSFGAAMEANMKAKRERESKEGSS